MKFTTQVSLLALTLISTPAMADDAPVKQPGKWVQDYTGRTPDPAITFGTLPNGLRYAIMRNTTPSEGLSMRLRIGSGSTVEKDDQRGLAHFLEHMAFRGSQHIADGEVVHILEAQGLRFGPDTNAFTAQDETVYMFNFPTGGDKAIDTGLYLLREIASRLTIAPAAVTAEKGVVLSEERLRDVASYRMTKANMGNLLAGTKAVERWPIGTTQSIRSATADKLRAYYEANYRPDNATLVVVGDVEPVSIERRIKSAFSDWSAPRRAIEQVQSQPSPKDTTLEFSDPAAPDVLSLSWVRPMDDRANTEALDNERLAQMVGVTVINNRISEEAGKEGSPFVGGSAGVAQNLMGAAALTQLAVTTSPDNWQKALETIIRDARRAIAAPIEASELQRAKTQILTMFQLSAQGALTRRSEDIANGIVQAVNEDMLVTAPSQDLAFATPRLATMGQAEVSESLHRAFSGIGPILFRSTRDNHAGATALRNAFNSAWNAPLQAQQAEAPVVWPYSSFGAPSRETSRIVETDLGTTAVTFANGSRLRVKPTPFEKGRIYIDVSFGNGRAGAPNNLIHALWATDLLALGGTGKLTTARIQRWAQEQGKAVTIKVQAGERAFHLSAATRPEDLAAQMQLLAAYIRDPGFRPELSEKMRAVAPMMASQIEGNAEAVFEREVERVYGGGDGRYDQVPSAADLSQAAEADIPCLLRDALDSSADVTMVGDIDIAKAVEVMGSTFAAGPPLNRAPFSPARLVMPHSLAPISVTHVGRADQAVYGASWALSDYYANPKRSYIADATASILQGRLLETAREKLGITYSPQVTAKASISLLGQGYLMISLETPPTNFSAFQSLLDREIADLATTPVSTAELERAKAPIIANAAKALESNGWWISTLPAVWREKRAVSAIVNEQAGARAVTANDIREFSRIVLAKNKPNIIIANAR